MPVKRKVKPPKKIRLDSKPKIRRRLFKLWSEAVRERDGHKCIKCGAHKGDDTCNKVDAHHYLQRNIKDSPLKFDIRNGGSLCPSCHKFNGEVSAHKSPIVFYDWLKQARPDDYQFVLSNAHVRVDLDRRDVLEIIEASLKAKQPLNIERLIKVGAIINESNSTGQLLHHVPDEQKPDAAVQLHGPGNETDNPGVPGVERTESSAEASAGLGCNVAS